MLSRLTKSIGLFAATVAMIGLEGCVQTVEDDYHYASCQDSRLNRPIVTPTARGEYVATPVGTQQPECAGAKRTFEIIADRAGG